MSLWDCDKIFDTAKLEASVSKRLNCCFSKCLNKEVVVNVRRSWANVVLISSVSTNFLVNFSALLSFSKKIKDKIMRENLLMNRR